MGNNLYGVISHSPRTVQYDGSTSDTATVYVDNTERVIKVDVNPSIMSGINLNSSLIRKVSAEVNTKTDAEYVDTSIDAVQRSLHNAEIELGRKIVQSRYELEELFKLLVPIELKSLETDYNTVELGTYFKELMFRWTTSRAIDTANLKVGDTSYSIDLNDLGINTTDYSAVIKADFDELLDTFEIDFGKLPQGVTDSFYNMFTAVATRILEPSLTIETDTDGHKIYRITAPYEYITNSNGIITIKGDMDI